MTVWPSLAESWFAQYAELTVPVSWLATSERLPERSARLGTVMFPVSWPWVMPVPVVEEKIRFVFADGAAEGATVLITLVGGAAGGEVVARVERRVAEEFEGAAGSLLPPDLVATSTCPPLKFPYSASKLLVRTLRSWIEFRDWEQRRFRY